MVGVVTSIMLVKTGCVDKYYSKYSRYNHVVFDHLIYVICIISADVVEKNETLSTRSRKTNVDKDVV